MSTIFYFFLIPIYKIKDIVFFIFKLIVNLLVILINSFFFILFLIGLLLINGVNSLFHSLVYIYIYLYWLSPFIYFYICTASFFLYLLPFLFIYFLICYYTIYLPGYRVFYFFGYSLFHFKYYILEIISKNDRIYKFYYYKLHYLYFLFLILFSIFFSFYFGEFNFLAYLFLIYWSIYGYYMLFFVLKQIGNMTSFLILLILNIMLLKNAIVLSSFIHIDENRITASDFIFELFNYRINSRASTQNFNHYKSGSYFFSEEKETKLKRLYKIILTFVNKREEENNNLLYDTYSKWYKLRNNRIDSYDPDCCKSYWVRNQYLNALLNKSDKVINDDLKNFYSDINYKKNEKSLKLSILDKEEYFYNFKAYLYNDFLDVEPTDIIEYRNLNFEERVRDCTYESYFLHRKLIQEEISTDIFFLPLDRNRSSMSYVLKNWIYKYDIQINDHVSEKVIDNYIDIENLNLDHEFNEMEDIESGKFPFFDILKELFFKDKEVKESTYINMYYDENLSSNKHMDMFFEQFNNVSSTFNKSAFYAFNEHYIYNIFSNFYDQDDIYFDEKFFNFQKDFKMREDWNLNRLYENIVEVIFKDTDKINPEKFEFQEYEFDEGNAKLYSKSEPEKEHKKLIDSLWFENPEFKDFISLESFSIKYHVGRNKHLYLLYDKLNYKDSLLNEGIIKDNIRY